MTRAEGASFDGKVAVVTGASRGIGEAIAQRLAAAGAHVLVSSRKCDASEAVAADIRARGGAAEALACHIGEPADIDALFAHLRAVHGRLDLLVNNAATNPYYGPIEATTPEAFQKTVDVNIRGTFLMSTNAVGLMREAGGGAILNVASINAVVPGDRQGIYSITKAAVVGMTKAFARECAPYNIRVNALLPGLTRTRFAGALLAGENEARWRGRIPMQRPAEPDEMAGAALYLLSPDAGYATGVALPVDGGALVA